MIELPEAIILSRQIGQELVGKEIRDVAVLQSPHKFAWFHGEAQEYPERLRGKVVTGSESHGGMVLIRLGETSLAFQDGPRLRYATESSPRPKKHQLLIDFTDSSYFWVSIQMYGGIACFDRDDWDNDYFHVALDKPSPLGQDFTPDYFHGLCDLPNFDKLSAKAFLATEQRVPGLGNGVLQDILFRAGIHPKRKMGTASGQELEDLYASIRSTLQTMVDDGGRDTEQDLFGEPGGYATVCSRKTVGSPCPSCGDAILKASYAGGSVYLCPSCQPLS